MDILLYNNHSEKNELNKNISDEGLFQGTLRQETSVTAPEVLIESTSFISSYNYAYIPDFDRYYYIIDVSVVRQSLWRVALKCDVLMSFRDSILACPAIINHTEVTQITDYADSDIWQKLVKDKTDIISFSHGLLESGEYILITAGGNQ